MLDYLEEVRNPYTFGQFSLDEVRCLGVKPNVQLQEDKNVLYDYPVDRREDNHAEKIPYVEYEV